MSPFLRSFALVPLAVAWCSVPLLAHDVTPNAFSLRPGTSDHIYVLDTFGCKADITAKSANPALFKVYALDMVKADGSLLPGGGTSITVKGRVDQVFVVVAEPNIATSQAANVEICWIGEDFGKTGPCQENNCNPYVPHLVAVTVSPTAENVASAPGGGIAGDPVATATGELFVDEPADLVLRGPLPFEFARRYSSRFVADGLPTGRLGPGWRHSFEWSLATSGSAVEITAGDGRQLRFEKGFFDAQYTLALGTDLPFALIDGAAGSYVLRDATDDCLRTFDANGRMTKVADGKGNELTLAYTSGRLASVADGLGRSLAFSYDGSSRLTMVTDGTRDVVCTYDGSGRLATVTDAASGVTTYSYSATLPSRALLAATMRPAGNVPWSQVYDVEGRVTTQSDAFGNLRSFAYDDAAGVTTITDPLLATQQHTHVDGRLTALRFENDKSAKLTYDEFGRRTAVTDRRGDRSTIAYDAAAGLPSAITSADGAVTRQTWSARVSAGFTFHDPLRTTFADGTFESYVHDASGNVLTRTDAGGGVWARTYGPRGELLTATAPDGGVSSFSWLANGLLDQATDPVGRITSYGYDSLGRVTDVMLPGGAMRHATWDDLDRLTSVTDEEGELTQLAWDANSNLSAVLLPGGKSWSFDYDAMDRLIGAMDPEGGVAAFAFDARGQPALLTDASGLTLELSWNGSGGLSGLVDGEGRSYAFNYDAEDVLASATDATGATTAFTTDRRGATTRIATPGGSTLRYSWDPLGRLTDAVDGEGGRREAGYDVSGRPVTLEVKAADAEVTITRDEVGRATGIGTGGGIGWTITHDRSDRVTGAVDPIGRELLATLDVVGRVDLVTLPSAAGTVDLDWSDRGELERASFSDGTLLQWQYDPTGNLTSATDVAITRDDVGRVEVSNGVSVTRDLAGRLATVQLAAGLTVNYAYDLSGRLTHVDDGVGSLDQTWDTVGRLATRVFGNGVAESYEWDDDGRLARFCLSGPFGLYADLKFERDDAGRITRTDRTQPVVGEPPLGEMSSVFDAAGQDAAFSYDALGRRTGDGARTFTYDLAGRLTNALDGLDDYDFSWNGLGNLATGQLNGGPLTEFTWNYATTQPSLAIVTEGGIDEHAYVATPTGQLLWEVDLLAGVRSYYHFDEQGNTLVETDDAGDVEQAYAWGANGELLAAWAAIVGYPYGLLALGARDFSVSLGVGVAFGDRVWDANHCSMLQPRLDPRFFARLGRTPYGADRFPQPSGAAAGGDEVRAPVWSDPFAFGIGGRWLDRTLGIRLGQVEPGGRGSESASPDRTTRAPDNHAAFTFASRCSDCHPAGLGQSVLWQLAGTPRPAGTNVGSFGDASFLLERSLLAGGAGALSNWLASRDRYFALRQAEPAPPALDPVNERRAIEKLLTLSKRKRQEAAIERFGLRLLAIGPWFGALPQGGIEPADLFLATLFPPSEDF